MGGIAGCGTSSRAARRGTGWRREGAPGAGASRGRGGCRERAAADDLEAVAHRHPEDEDGVSDDDDEGTDNDDEDDE